MNDPFEEPVDPEDVADVLALIADPPNLRQAPKPYDLAGHFDEWFDGGAVRHADAYSEYVLEDGVIATVEDTEVLSVIIRFGSRTVLVRQIRPEDLVEEEDDDEG